MRTIFVDFNDLARGGLVKAYDDGLLHVGDRVRLIDYFDATMTFTGTVEQVDSGSVYFRADW